MAARRRRRGSDDRRSDASKTGQGRCQAGPSEERAVTRRDRAASCQTHPRRKFGRLRLRGQAGHFASGRWARVQTQISTGRTKTDACVRLRRAVGDALSKKTNPTDNKYGPINQRPGRRTITRPKTNKLHQHESQSRPKIGLYWTLLSPKLILSLLRNSKSVFLHYFFFVPELSKLHFSVST